ncbi:entericidin A/B family lipoprotein [Indioceanicola profundi]|nr:entericidin A/B family lipoprotein [Indioceanicola profundi]
MKRLRTALPAILLASLALLTACNTVEGIGKDLQRAGEAIEGAGEKGKR